MKRSGLRRRSPLKARRRPSGDGPDPSPMMLTCAVCGATFAKPASWSRKQTCSPECYRELQKRVRPKHLKGVGHPRYKHGGDIGKHPGAEETERWRAGASSVCAICEASAEIHLHHVVYRQEIRKAKGDQCDPRNRLSLCPSCHTAHHQRSVVIPLALLPSSAYEFAVELLGPGAAYEYLRRRYVGYDRRLQALLGEKS